MTQEMIDNQELEQEPDRIAKTFSGKTIFLTGGTGFVGKVLVEKFLRLCPDIGKILMLVRPKKGKNPKQRFQEILSGPLFAQVRDMYDFDTLTSRVTLIEGDIRSENLNLSKTDKDLCSEAEILIHGAATIRFDDTLKECITINTRGTKYVLELAKQFKKLKLFVYLSTAYCHPEEKVLEEKAYEPRYDPHEIIQAIDNVDDELFAELTSKILKDIPNAYTLSKALAEALVDEASTELPTLVLRPSVVIPILYEPLPGWSDNFNGPAGLLVAAGKGVLRTIYGDENNYVDYMPVDIFANAVFITIWNCLCNGDRNRYYNITSSSQITVRWAQLLDIGKKIVINKIPFNNTLWVPGGTMTKSRTLHRIRAVYLHWIPAILVDILLLCLGIKPVLMRVHNRINKGVNILEYYLENQWTFICDKGQNLRKLLNKRELALYKSDSEGLDLENYIENSIKFIRLYLLKESDETLPRARIIMKIMKYLDMLISIVFWCVIAYWIGGWMYNIFFDNNL